MGVIAVILDCKIDCECGVSSSRNTVVEHSIEGIKTIASTADCDLAREGDCCDELELANDAEEASLASSLLWQARGSTDFGVLRLL